MFALGLPVASAEGACLWLFHPEVAQVISQEQLTQESQSSAAISKTYGARLASDETDISLWTKKENGLQQSETHYLFLYRCELGLVSCSSSGRIGDGPYAQRDLADANAAQAQLAALEPIANQRIKADEADVSTAQRDEAARLSDSSNTIWSDGGLLAQEEALGQVMAKNTDAAVTVWFVRSLMALIDLIALSGKWMLLKSGRLTAEDFEAADRKRDLTEATRIAAEADVLNDLHEQTKWADMEVNRLLVDEERERRIDEAMGNWAATGTDGPRSHFRAQPIDTPSLASLIDRAVPHEHEPVSTNEGLRRGALVGSALLLVSLGGVLLEQFVGHRLLRGGWLVEVTAAGVGCLAGYSKAFRTGPGWVHWAVFTTLIVGLAAPVALLALNL